MRCFRTEPRSEDPVRCLTEEGPWTEPWGGSDDQEPCEKCRGLLEIGYERWSCILTGARPDCPACGGKARWRATCPVCRGTGEIDGKPRHGVSVFPTVEGLYHYTLAKGADLADSIVVKLEAGLAEDVGFDADQGAVLVILTALIRTTPADAELADRVRELSAAG